MGHRPSFRRLRRLGALTGIGMLGIASLFIAVPAMAQAQEMGQVRLGHLSPTTPAVDIYVTAPGAEPSRVPLARDAGYGAVTSYQRLPAGRYVVDMRAAGADPTSAAPLTSAVEVTPGSAQSLFFFDTGAMGAVQGQLVTDDLTPAAPGSGRVRVVQGSAAGAPIDMQAAGGPRLATALQYGTITDYASVGARSWDVAIASGAEQVQTVLDVADGSVSTVVLTRDTAGGLVVTPIVDVEGGLLIPGAPELSGPPVAAPGEEQAPPAQVEPQMPQGGVPAGGGATAGSPDPLPVLLAIGGALLLVFASSGSPLPRVRQR